jgi:hypothetical protein
MTYASTNPPVMISQTVAGPKIWIYQSTDGASTVDASGYFTDGYNRGMRQGDICLVTDTDASPVITTSHVVNVTGTTVDLSDGVTLGSTNSD